MALRSDNGSVEHSEPRICTGLALEPCRTHMTKIVKRHVRWFTVLSGLIVVLMRPGAAAANVIVLTDYSLGNPHFTGNAAGGGGPFKASTTGDALGIAEFLTFCLEFNEYFSYGTSYNFELSDSAGNGGVAGGHPDPVSDATKWLYYEAVSGGYTSMYSAATGLGLSSSVGAHFQNAIWLLEQERTAGEIGGTGSAGYLLANYALANQNWGALFALGNRVYAMNLTDARGGLHQDQLAYRFEAPTRETSVPEPASLMLLGMGLLAVGHRLRRRV
jgi:hypothetical protein